MDVYWLEQTEPQVPAGNDWLSPVERALLDSMPFPKRRNDWRLGRWTAKQAVTACLNLTMTGGAPPLPEIEILSAVTGAPDVVISRRPAELAISLTHRSGLAACAVAPAGTALGCDLEVIEPRSDAFIGDYLTAQERELVTQCSSIEQPRLVNLLWSAKESALKALHAGLRLDTRSVTVHPVFDIEPSLADDWHPLHASCLDGQVFYGWWQGTADLVRTLVASPPPDPPILLVTQRFSAA